MEMWIERVRWKEISGGREVNVERWKKRASWMERVWCMERDRWREVDGEMSMNEER
jgi:hypothetical protein